MRTKFIAPFVTMALFGALLAGVSAPANAAPAPQAAAAAAKAPAAKATVAPISSDGQVSTDAGVAVGSLTGGTFTPTKFVQDNGKLAVVGTVTGLLNGNPISTTGVAEVLSGAPSGTATAAALAPDAISIAATCEILELVLGPLHLNLLGLVVDLNQVVLTITAVTGALLGDLLCSIANLLNGGLALNGLITLLNRLLGF
jgi:hypothetical protein